MVMQKEGKRNKNELSAEATNGVSKRITVGCGIVAAVSIILVLSLGNSRNLIREHNYTFAETNLRAVNQNHSITSHSSMRELDDNDHHSRTTLNQTKRYNIADVATNGTTSTTKIILTTPITESNSDHGPAPTNPPPTSAPVAPTSSPVAETSAPVVPTSAPVAEIAAPVAPTSAPAAETIITSSTADSYPVVSGGYINQWAERIREGGYVYFKHLRKAAGTSMLAYLKKVINYHCEEVNCEKKYSGGKKNDTIYPWMVYHQEWRAMPRECPFHDPLWNKSINVIVLRNPIDRQLSEFFYSGYGRKVRKMKRLGEKVKVDATYEKEAVELMKVLIPSWMENKKSYGRGGYSHNYQLHMISGVTDDIPKTLKGQVSKTWFDGPCSYGRAVYGGVYPGHATTEESLRYAKAALKEYSMVLITETLSKPEQAEMVASMVGVPESVATLAKQRSNVRTNAVKTKKNTLFKGYADLIQRHDPEFYDFVVRNMTGLLDIELYQHALEVNRNKTAQWRLEMDALNVSSTSAANDLKEASTSAVDAL